MADSFVFRVDGAGGGPHVKVFDGSTGAASHGVTVLAWARVDGVSPTDDGLDLTLVEEAGATDGHLPAPQHPKEVPPREAPPPPPAPKDEGAHHAPDGFQIITAGADGLF